MKSIPEHIRNILTSFCQQLDSPCPQYEMILYSDDESAVEVAQCEIMEIVSRREKTAHQKWVAACEWNDDGYLIKEQSYSPDPMLPFFRALVEAADHRLSHFIDRDMIAQIEVTLNIVGEKK
jgi:hypothetical protein